MKTLLAFILFTAAAFGQVKVLGPTDPVNYADLNSNNSWLAANPIAEGSSLPVSCTTGNRYFLTTDSSLYRCESGTWVRQGFLKASSAPAACALHDVWLDTTVPAWKTCTVAGTPGTWTVFGGSGSESVGGLADPGGNGIMKRTALNTTEPAVPGVDYVAISPSGGLDLGGLPMLWTGLHAATTDCGTVPANQDCVFPNSANADHLTRKSPDGVLHDVEAPPTSAETIAGFSGCSPGDGKFLKDDGTCAAPAGGGGGVIPGLPITLGSCQNGVFYGGMWQSDDTLPHPSFACSSVNIVDPNSMKLARSDFYNSADDTMVYQFIMPANYTGGLATLQIPGWPGSGTGDVQWQVGSKALAIGDRFDTGDYNYVTGIRAQAASWHYAVITINVDTTGWAAGKLICLKLTRLNACTGCSHGNMADTEYVVAATTLMVN